MMSYEECECPYCGGTGKIQRCEPKRWLVMNKKTGERFLVDAAPENFELALKELEEKKNG